MDKPRILEKLKDKFEENLQKFWNYKKMYALFSISPLINKFCVKFVEVLK